MIKHDVRYLGMFVKEDHYYKLWHNKPEQLNQQQQILCLRHSLQYK